MKNKERLLIGKLGAYADDLIEKRGVKISKEEYERIFHDAHATSLELFKNSNYRVNLTQIFFNGMCNTFKKYLKEKGLPEKEVDEFLKELKKKYHELRRKITPYID